MAHRLAPEILNVEQIAIDAGEFFDLESLQADEVTEANLFGEYTLEEQRHFNILCLNLWQESTKRKNFIRGSRYFGRTSSHLR
jgi:hypothetical protein